MSTIRAMPYGPTAVLFEVATTGEATALARAIRRHDGVIDVVGGARTVLVNAASADALRGIEHAVTEITLTDAEPSGGAVVEVPTIYDGPDLADVATLTGLSVADVVARHADAEYQCAFCGFVPGFAYLSGLADELRLPRRASPRTRVPAGSVAVGADFTGVYPTASPGGWHLLGRTDVVLWDAGRTRPALIEPGDRVRFVPVSS